MSGLLVAVAWSSQQMAVEKCCKKAVSASEPKQPEREGLGPSTRCFYLQHIHSGRGGEEEGGGKPSRLQSQVQASHLGEGGAFYLLFIPLCHFDRSLPVFLFFFSFHICFFIEVNLTQLRLQCFLEEVTSLFFIFFPSVSCLLTFPQDRR